MLFNEIYGNYYKVLARIIEKSINNILTTLSICVFSIVPTHVECVVLMSKAK